MMTPEQCERARRENYRVKIVEHEYSFDGMIITVFRKRDSSKIRVVVENDDGICLIQNPKNLVLI